MSVQGVNSTVHSGFVLTGVTGSPNGFIMRDSSDYTRFIKQSKRYISLKGNTGKTDVTILQSNNTRLTYNFGAMGCTGGSGCAGPFPNVPLGV